jgi:hypothetical protein
MTTIMESHPKPNFFIFSKYSLIFLSNLIMIKFPKIYNDKRIVFQQSKFQ